VPQILELAQLAHGDGVAQMQVSRARVIATIDTERPPCLLRFNQPLAQLLRHDSLGMRVAVFRPLHQGLDLLVY